MVISVNGVMPYWFKRCSLLLPQGGPTWPCYTHARYLYSSDLVPSIVLWQTEGSSYCTPVKQLPVKCKHYGVGGPPLAPSLLSTLVSGAARRVRSKDVVKDPRQRKHFAKILNSEQGSVPFLSSEVGSVPFRYQEVGSVPFLACVPYRKF